VRALCVYYWSLISDGVSDVRLHSVLPSYSCTSVQAVRLRLMNIFARFQKTRSLTKAVFVRESTCQN